MSLYSLLRTTTLPLKEIDYYLPNQGLIVDLGCGKGIIAEFLSRRTERLVVGVDKLKKNLPKKCPKNLMFKSADITAYKIKNVQGIVISDVLHHLNLKDQKGLLKNIAKNINKQGILVVKEIDASEFIRSSLSRFWDFVFYPQDKINYWHSQKLKFFLKNLGFKVQVKRTTRFFPGSTTLFICKR